MKPAAAPRRPVIEGVRPQVDCGRFPAKAAVSDEVVVEAKCFVDGHDLLTCELRYQGPGQSGWSTSGMEPLGNDRWRGTFRVEELGRYRFCVRAGVDRYATWRRDLLAWADAGEDIRSELRVGSALLEQCATRARGADQRLLAAASAALAAADGLDASASAADLCDAGVAPAADPDAGVHGEPSAPGTPVGTAGTGTTATPAVTAGPATPATPAGTGGTAGTVGDLVQDERLAALARRYRPPGGDTTSAPSCTVVVEPERARFSTWYELFPRSASPVPGRPGTLADVMGRLDYLERLGIDVLYLPPIHPIGRTGRKGMDGSTAAGPDDPGSPWAIGSEAGGHTAVDPALGTLSDFDALVAAAGRRGIAVALDIAFQCSPDHPWVREHPEWFRHRPDGTIRYAENPPKRYQDIYPLDFETEAWWELWCALLDVVRFWIGHGVSIFRVDNPHTKPFAFWEWLIATVKEDHPETIFLSEAFTRPAVMYRLAKLGFSQSYTYFAWRNTKWELETYMAELREAASFFRPSFWPNTPDILTERLQTGGTAAFVSRLVLASTLAASYGVYGPAFELQEHVARSPGSEEYAGSEKYALRHWDLDRADSLAGLMARINEIRRLHPALQRDDTLQFHATDNEQVIAYSKRSAGDVVLVIVNLDPRYRQSAWVDIEPLSDRRHPGDGVLEVHDLLTDARFRWEGSHSFVILDPATVPAHVLSTAPASPTEGSA